MKKLHLLKINGLPLLLALFTIFFAAACTVPFIPKTTDSNTSREVTAPAWAAGTSYTVGQVVSYDGILYTCRQAHTAIVSWEPPNVPALWLPGDSAPSVSPSVTPSVSPSVTPSVLPSVAPSVAPSVVPSSVPAGVWTPGTSYTVGQVVSYNGSTYTCLQAHTALVGWEPPNVPALWKAGGTITPTSTPTVSPSISPSVSPSIQPSVTPSISPTITPSPTPNGSLPRHIMSGYWHNWGGGPGFIPLASVNANWDVINVSFAVPVSPGSTDGNVTFAATSDSGYSDTQFRTDVKTMQAKGKKIVLAIGGYEGFFSLTSSAAATNFANKIKGYINSYGFDGIDIDLEQSSVQLVSGGDADFKNPTSPKVVYLIQALKAITDAYGSNFILSFAPETMYLQQGYQYYGGINMYVDPRCGSYIPVIYALGNRVTYVQAQLYNSGQIQGTDGNYYGMGDAASIVAMCKMLLTGFNLNQDASHFWAGLRPDQVVIGLPASSSAAGSGQVSNATLQQAFSTLNSQFPGLRGIMAWSINWDNFQNGNSFASTNRAYLNGLSQ